MANLLTSGIPVSFLPKSGAAASSLRRQALLKSTISAAEQKSTVASPLLAEQKSAVPRPFKGEDIEGAIDLPVEMCEPRDDIDVFQKFVNEFLFTDEYRESEIAMSPGGRVITILGRDFIRDKELGKGSVGTVFRYKSASLKTVIAVKFTEEDDEARISDDLRKAGCNVLRERFWKKTTIPLQISKGYAYFMEIGEGNLTEYCRKLVDHIKHGRLTKDQAADHLLQVAENIRVQMLCVYNFYKNYVYTDLKTANILYRCDDPKKLWRVRFFLGDLGGAVPRINTYVSTYPPIETWDQGFGQTTDVGVFPLYTNTEKEHAMAWQIGMLLADFAVLLDQDPNRESHYDHLSHIGIRKVIHKHDFYNKYLKPHHQELFFAIQDNFRNNWDNARLLDRDPYRRKSIFESLL